jgi:hypothetical protein
MMREECKLGKVIDSRNFQILTHLALHLVNFVQLEHALRYYTPRFVGVISVITYYFGCEHEGGHEKMVGEQRWENSDDVLRAQAPARI